MTSSVIICGIRCVFDLEGFFPGSVSRNRGREFCVSDLVGWVYEIIVFVPGLEECFQRA